MQAERHRAFPLAIKAAWWDRGCQGQITQLWYHDPDGLLRNKNNPDKCADVKDAWWGAFDGQDLHLWDYQNSWGQTWHWE